MNDDVRLTTLSHGGGCGCKIGPGELRTLVSRIPATLDPRLLVGIETGDDAAVYKVRDDLAIIGTLDFFMPIVDDPFDFGRIAAANAISDVYAMGGTPIYALSIIGLPTAKLSMEVGARILEGGASICGEAGIGIVGGHSIDDTEPKFGLSVTGTVHPDQVWRNSTARAGDLLVLTKPIGVGTLASSVKKQQITPEDYATLVRTTTFLNRIPCEAGRAVGVNAATDVTGFSLLGHASTMARGSGLTLELWFDEVPLLEGARRSIAGGTVPGATGRNLVHFGATTVWDASLDDVDQKLLADPQTSGGLLFSVAPDRVEPLLAELRGRGALAAAVVGRMVERGESLAVVRRARG